MPLRLPDRLPAIDILKNENIFVMDNSRATTQDDAGHSSFAYRHPEPDAFEDYNRDRPDPSAFKYTFAVGDKLHETEESYPQEYTDRAHDDVLS